MVVAVAAAAAGAADVHPSGPGERTQLADVADRHGHVALGRADREVVLVAILARLPGQVELDPGERELERHAPVVDRALALDRQRRRRHRHAQVHRREAAVRRAATAAAGRSHRLAARHTSTLAVTHTHLNTSRTVRSGPALPAYLATNSAATSSAHDAETKSLVPANVKSTASTVNRVSTIFQPSRGAYSESGSINTPRRSSSPSSCLAGPAAESGHGGLYVLLLFLIYLFIILTIRLLSDKIYQTALRQIFSVGRSMVVHDRS